MPFIEEAKKVKASAIDLAATGEGGLSYEKSELRVSKYTVMRMIIGG